jgi:hypothetical protein
MAVEDSIQTINTKIHSIIANRIEEVKMINNLPKINIVSKAVNYIEIQQIIDQHHQTNNQITTIIHSIIHKQQINKIQQYKKKSIILSNNRAGIPHRVINFIQPITQLCLVVVLLPKQLNKKAIK